MNKYQEQILSDASDLCELFISLSHDYCDLFRAYSSEQLKWFFETIKNSSDYHSVLPVVELYYSLFQLEESLNE